MMLHDWFWSFILLCMMPSVSTSFLLAPSDPKGGQCTMTSIHMVPAESPKKPGTRGPSKKSFTIADLRREMEANPAKFQPAERKSKYRRTRKRVENPKQQYLYKNQRIALEREGKLKPKDGKGEEVVTRPNDPSRDPLIQAKEFGLMIGAQHCDPLVDGVEPKIVGRIRVGKDLGCSGSYAYLIDKPAGWAVLGGAKQATPPSTENRSAKETPIPKSKKKKNRKKVIRVEEEDGSLDFLEFDESEILALMTPEEIEEYNEALSDTEAGNAVTSKQEWQPDSELEEAKIDDAHNNSNNDYSPVAYSIETDDELSEQTEANLKRIEARLSKIEKDEASFSDSSRPSVVSWLKELKADEGQPIKGGNFWTALSGASDVDDSGLLLLCPKANVNNLFVEQTHYFAVVGTGGFLAPQGKIKKDSVIATKESIQMDVVSKLRRGREDDIVQTVKIIIPETASSCASVIAPCQDQLKEGIRGDPSANPFDRRARRRLIHCSGLSVSSLIADETLHYELSELPSDISILAERSGTKPFSSGSFLGRSSLRKNPQVTAYREINGAADGFPGWFVDRYDKWLFIQHDPRMPQGPIPSIHDGNTAGVYYLEASQDRSAMGSDYGVRPRLKEGQRAVEPLVIVENGVNYKVSLDQDLSTGIFLDQRPQRAWLSKNCCDSTSVLNCFAHTGAFSVAAAAAGASTVSLDLSKKWLGRIPEHFEANGIPFDERHDCIYGDCFDWLSRLGKRNEKYDIVILDPPSSSVGRKKKRWSVKNDMNELVALAAPLVKSGGLLWTTTNSANIHPIKFARLCSQGLQDAGINNAKLERIQPMPHDFPSIGAQPVKNLVWRIP